MNMNKNVIIIGVVLLFGCTSIAALLIWAYYFKPIVAYNQSDLKPGSNINSKIKNVQNDVKFYIQSVKTGLYMSNGWVMSSDISNAIKYTIRGNILSPDMDSKYTMRILISSDFQLPGSDITLYTNLNYNDDTTRVTIVVDSAEGINITGVNYLQQNSFTPDHQYEVNLIAV